MKRLLAVLLIIGASTVGCAGQKAAVHTRVRAQGSAGAGSTPYTTQGDPQIVADGQITYSPPPSGMSPGSERILTSDGVLQEKGVQAAWHGQQVGSPSSMTFALYSDTEADSSGTPVHQDVPVWVVTWPGSPFHFVFDAKTGDQVRAYKLSG
jgi:hypothetical protein